MTVPGADPPTCEIAAPPLCKWHPAAYDLTSFVTNLEQVMRTVSLAEAKTHFSELVTQVAGGEEVVITRHGQPIVRLCGVEKTKIQLASRARFRAQLPRLEQPSATLIRSLREEER